MQNEVVASVLTPDLGGSLLSTSGYDNSLPGETNNKMVSNIRNIILHHSILLMT